MRSPNKRETQPIGCIAAGFIQTIYFDMEFNYIRGSVERTSIFPDEPDNWESESCKLIPYVRYEYTRVCKKDPETNQSARAGIDRAREKVKFFASVKQNNGSVLRIVKDTIVRRLDSNVNAIIDVTVHYLEDSHGSLMTDPIASERRTREMPCNLKAKAKATSKKNGSRSNVRPVK